MRKLLLSIVLPLLYLFTDAQQRLSYSFSTYYCASIQQNIASLEYSLKDSVYANNLPPNASGFGEKVNIQFFEKATKIETPMGYRYLLH